MGLTAEIPRELVKGISFGIGPTSRVIAILRARPFGSKEAIFNAMWSERPDCDQPQMTSLDVYISNARKVLRPHGVEIKNIRGQGWYLDSTNKAKLRAVIERLNHEQQAAA